MYSPALETNPGTAAPACELAAPLLPAGLFTAPRFHPDFPSPPRFREGIRSNPYKNQAPTHSRKSAEKRCPLLSTAYKLPCFPLRSISCVFCRLHTPGGGGHPPYSCPMLATRRHPTRMSILRSGATKGHSTLATCQHSARELPLSESAVADESKGPSVQPPTSNLQNCAILALSRGDPNE